MTDGNLPAMGPRGPKPMHHKAPKKDATKVALIMTPMITMARMFITIRGTGYEYKDIWTGLGGRQCGTITYIPLESRRQK